MGIIALTGKELHIVKLLRERGVLENVSWEEFYQDHNGILVLCPDCDQSEQEEYHLANVRRLHGVPPRIHRLQYNGGALNIAPQSPLNATLPRGAVLIEDIKETIVMKGIERVGLSSHYSCGKGRKHEISLTQNIDLSIAGKRHMRGILPPNIVLGCFFYVCLGQGMGRTYFLNRPKWEEWREDFLSMDT